MVTYFLYYTHGLVAHSVRQWIHLKLRQPEFRLMVLLRLTKKIINSQKIGLSRFTLSDIHDAILKHLSALL